MEYLTSESAQLYFADGNNEYPVIDLGNNSSAVQSLGTFKEDTLNVGQLGEYQAKAIEIYDAVGWQ
jgi:iron(III) transport system substrate-binding protein